LLHTISKARLLHKYWLSQLAFHETNGFNFFSHSLSICMRLLIIIKIMGEEKEKIFTNTHRTRRSHVCHVKIFVMTMHTNYPKMSNSYILRDEFFNTMFTSPRKYMCVCVCGLWGKKIKYEWTHSSDAFMSSWTFDLVFALLFFFVGTKLTFTNYFFKKS
jgi:hypothetical protein